MRVIIDNKYNIGDEVVYFVGDSYNQLGSAKVTGVGYSKQRKECVYSLHDEENDDYFMDYEDNLYADEVEAINTIL